MDHTQNGAVLAALEAGEEITQLDALRRWGIGRLAARIHELRHGGAKIKTALRTVKAASGRRCRIAVYSIEAGR